MAVQGQSSVINNSNLKTICNDCGIVGLALAVAYTYNASTKVVEITNTTTLPAGHAYKRFKVKVHDFFGNEVIASNTDGSDMTVAGTDEIDVSSLNHSKPLAISVMISTDGGVVADGAAYGLQSAGDISHWDAQQNAANEL